MDTLGILDLMLKDMEKADDYYKPTNFWSTGLPAIVDDLKRQGFNNFREHESAQSFYVPNYASGIWKRYGKIISTFLNLVDKRYPTKPGLLIADFLSGQHLARADHRALLASYRGNELDFSHLSESNVGGGERYNVGGATISKTFLNYCRGLSCLGSVENLGSSLSVLEIGGGFGSLGEILLKLSRNNFYLNVDIPPVAAVSSYYLSELFGKENVLTYEKSKEMSCLEIDEIKQKYLCAVLCPWQLPKVKGEVDLFVNFMSFQEMEPDIVLNYIHLVQPLVKKFVLMRNSMHGKSLALSKGAVGVLRQTPNDLLIASFDKFRLLKRDSYIFGDVNHRNDFFSEVMVLKNKELSSVPFG